jgi:hypothetical protein
MGEKCYKNIPHQVRTYSIVASDDFGTLSSIPDRSPGVPYLKSFAAGSVIILVLFGGYWAFQTFQNQQVSQAQDGRYGGQVCMGPARGDDPRVGEVADPQRHNLQTLILTGVFDAGIFPNPFFEHASRGLVHGTRRLLETLANGVVIVLRLNDSDRNSPRVAVGRCDARTRQQTPHDVRPAQAHLHWRDLEWGMARRGQGVGAASGVAITSKGEKTRLNGWELWEAQQPGETRWIRIDVLRVA